MATVYHVGIGSRSTTADDGIHGPMEIFNHLLRLILIDGEAETDRWLRDPRGDQAGIWPDDGRWTVSLSMRQITFTQAHDGKILGRLNFKTWPLRRGDEGKALLTSPYNGKNEFIFYVTNIE